MSKRGYISRYLLILKKLKATPYSTFEELQSYIENQFDYLQMQDDTLNIGFSKRTLQRDIREINNIFGLNIEYSKSEKGYFINKSEAENMNFLHMIEVFDLFNSLNLAHELSPYIHMEKRKPLGTENLYGLLHAIKNRFKIKFLYKKFEEHETTKRIIEPYILKEFKSRWYIMGKDNNDNIIKSFALDRLTNIEITNKTFPYTDNYNVEQNYRYCFGIISPNDEEAQDIVLSFDPIQGKYIKTLPLHETQKILVDTDNELQISLKLFVTHDLIMELLSFGDSLKVIKPKTLITEIKTAHEKAYKQY